MNTAKKCAKCGTTRSITFHHYYPRNVGDRDNGLWLCAECHTQYHRITSPHYRKKKVKKKDWYLISFFNWLLGNSGILFLLLII